MLALLFLAMPLVAWFWHDCCYRDGRFILPEEDFELYVDDEVVVITHSRNLPALETRWGHRKPGRRGH